MATSDITNQRRQYAQHRENWLRYTEQATRASQLARKAKTQASVKRATNLMNTLGKLAYNENASMAALIDKCGPRVMA